MLEGGDFRNCATTLVNALITLYFKICSKIFENQTISDAHYSTQINSTSLLYKTNCKVDILMKRPTKLFSRPLSYR